MATDLVLPRGTFPSNLHLSAKVKYAQVDSDVFDICERIAEISERLYVIDLEDDATHCYAIVEDCDDGTQALVFRVKELDARILPRLQRMLQIPFNQRIKHLEKENYEWELSEEERRWEEMYERMGRGFWHDLEKSGFIQRPLSFPKKGITPTRD